MVGMLAIAAAAGWLLAFSLCAVVTRLPPRWAGSRLPGRGRAARGRRWLEPGGDPGPAERCCLPGHRPRSRGQGPSHDHTTDAWAAVVRCARRCTGGHRSRAVRAAGARRREAAGGPGRGAVRGGGGRAVPATSGARGPLNRRCGPRGGRPGDPAEAELPGAGDRPLGGAPRGRRVDRDSPCIVHLPVIPCGMKAPRQGGVAPGPAQVGPGAGGPVPARGPVGAAVMGAAAWVTSRGGDTRQVGPGAAVRDASRDNRRGAAARAAEISAAADRSRWPVNWQAGQVRTRPAGLGIRTAGGAGRGGAALVD